MHMMRHPRLIAMALLLMFPAVASAIPTLQLHIADSVYDPVSESWTIVDSSPTLEVIGATSPSWVNLIDEVTLYVSVPEEYYNPLGSITIQGLDSGNPTPDLVPSVYDHLGFGGRAPDGFGVPIYDPEGYPYSASLPPHDIWPAYYWEISLPDLVVDPNSELIQNWDPDDLTATDTGDIQQYAIEFMGFDEVHFDLAGVGISCTGKETVRLAPFSHDAYADGDDGPSGDSYIPEPATFVLLGIGLVGLSAAKRRRKR